MTAEMKRPPRSLRSLPPRGRGQYPSDGRAGTEMGGARAGETPTRFDAVVLAGDRSRHDPVAAAAGVAAKCLTPIGGTPMVVRVVRALEQSARVDGILLCGPARETLDGSPELRALVAGGVRWVAPQATPSH